MPIQLKGAWEMWFCQNMDVELWGGLGDSEYYVHTLKNAAVI